MGLGKTVEIICLMLLNPRPTEGNNNNGQENKLSDDETSSVSLSSGQDSDVRQASSSDESDFENTRSNGRKRKSMLKKKTQQNKLVKKAKRIDSDSDDDMESGPPIRQTNLRRGKRSNSPCTFLTESGEVDAKMNPDLNVTPTWPNRKHAKTGIPKTLLKTTEPTTTYEKMKAIYDAQLLEFSGSLKANRPRFHGTFFDTKIQRTSRFECICGGSNDDHRNKVRWQYYFFNRIQNYFKLKRLNY